MGNTDFGETQFRQTRFWGKLLLANPIVEVLNRSQIVSDPFRITFTLVDSKAVWDPEVLGAVDQTLQHFQNGFLKTVSPQRFPTNGSPKMVSQNGSPKTVSPQAVVQTRLPKNGPKCERFLHAGQQHFCTRACPVLAAEVSVLSPPWCR